MRRIILIVIPTIVVLAYFLYRSMGGGSELQFEVVETGARHVNGEWFEGRPASPDLESLFFKMRDASSFEDSLFLCVVNVPVEKEDTIRQFIGLIQEKKTFPNNYQIASGRYVVATMDMHTAVRPSPENVAEQANSFAAKNGLTLQSDEDIQIFTSSSEIQIMFKAAD